MLAEKPTTSNSAKYAAIGNVPTRNGLQSRVEVPLLLRALRLPLGGRVLQIACGRGVAAGPCGASRAIEADVRDLPFESGSFDLVIDFGTRYHVSGGREGARAALSEVARVLRADGLFVHETPVAQHLAHPVRSFGRTLP